MTSKLSFGDSFRKSLHGEFSIVVHYPDGRTQTSVSKNIITDVGLKHLGDILAGDETTDLDLGFIEPGIGTTPADISDTDTETELPGSPTTRLPITLQSRATTSPFEVSIEGFIDTGDYTRPETITELCVFFTDIDGDIFARSVLASSVLLSTGATATINYSLVFR